MKIAWVKELNIRFLLGLGLFCVFAAVANNLRAPEDKSVEWIGGQEVLEKPE
ncbi:MAG: hypothetical protein LBQ87_00395 [Candidatus Fibromonas sp.]|jgi:hypothetical protein|nr:hypothetical protein [Candidatus Fibromonas sp.]